MNDIDRAIAEKLGWHTKRRHDDSVGLYTPDGKCLSIGHTAEQTWLIAKLKYATWSQDIAAALGLVEELGISLTLRYLPTSKKYVAVGRDVRLRPYESLSDTPAEAVTRVILTGLEAKESTP